MWKQSCFVWMALRTRNIHVMFFVPRRLTEQDNTNKRMDWLFHLYQGSEFLTPTFPQPFAMSFMIIQIIYKLNPTPFAVRALLWWNFYCRRRVRKVGFKGSGGVRLSLSGFWEIAAFANSGVTLKGLRGVENAAVAVEESCVLDVWNSADYFFRSCSCFFGFLKVTYLFCNWKYRLAFS